eukprot:2672970-Pleurochrysis_carterae.AAC.2
MRTSRASSSLSKRAASGELAGRLLRMRESRQISVRVQICADDFVLKSVLLCLHRYARVILFKHVRARVRARARPRACACACNRRFCE